MGNELPDGRDRRCVLLAHFRRARVKFLAPRRLEPLCEEPLILEIRPGLGKHGGQHSSFRGPPCVKELCIRDGEMTVVRKKKLDGAIAGERERERRRMPPSGVSGFLIGRTG